MKGGEMGGKRKIRKLFEQVEQLEKNEEIQEFLKLMVSFYPKYRKKILQGEEIDFLEDEVPFWDRLKSKGFLIKFGSWRESSYMHRIVYFAFELFRQAFLEEFKESE